ncbi:MAG TPA: O-antigen ligase family protein [Gaiellaceae bacterium]|nr:O-antigen ligase family protein [Gaiellaceae bacterium]
MLIGRRHRSWLVALATAALVAAAAGSQGAYFSQSWGWVALGFLGALCVATLLGSAHLPSRPVGTFAIGLTAYACWMAASTAWSVSAPGSVRELERFLVYLSVGLAVAFVARRTDAYAVVAGVHLGITGIALYALWQRLFPDTSTTAAFLTPLFRAEPIGYRNSLGLFAALGVLLALALGLYGRTRPVRLVATASTVPLAALLYLSFSRGAWIGLGVGLMVAIALDPHRVRLVTFVLAVSVPAIVCIALVSREELLTTDQPLEGLDVTAAGMRALFWIFALTCASGGLAWPARVAARRAARSGVAARVVNLGVPLLLVAALAVPVVAFGGPSRAIAEFQERFSAPPSAGFEGNSRLFDLSGNRRGELLAVAWDAALERPITGHGAGAFEYLWYERRTTHDTVRDAHSLYAEAFAELGGVGLLLLVATLATPFAAAFRSRQTSLVPLTTGGFAAWVAHSAIDWHWEVVAVTLAAFLCAAIPLVMARRGQPRPLSGRATVVVVAAGIALSIAAVVSLVGNQALFASQEALARNEPAEATEHARRARTLLPWSAEPHLALGDARAALGDREGALRAYRDAVETNPRSWVAWLHLAQVARGREREAAYARVHELNPREGSLPGEGADPRP